MTIHMTLSEVAEECRSWQEFCEDKGFSEYAIREGGGDVEVQLTKEEVLKYEIFFEKSYSY